MPTTTPGTPKPRTKSAPKHERAVDLILKMGLAELGLFVTHFVKKDKQTAKYVTSELLELVGEDPETTPSS